jgi:hypothetical protein
MPEQVSSEQLNRVQPDAAFWIIGVVALLWYLIGLFIYYSTVSATPEQLAQSLTPEQVAIVTGMPAWVTAANAIAVVAGVIASILLLMRNKLAVPLYIVSLVAAIVQDVFVFGMSGSVEAFGMQPVIIQGLVLIIGIFLVWYSRARRAAGVLA